MKLNPKYMGITVIAIFMIGIGIAVIAGLWETESPKLEGTYLTDETTYANESEVNVKGSYTFADLSSYYEIPIEHFSEAFNMSTSAAKSFKCKDISTLYEEEEFEVGVGAIKVFVAFYRGLDYDITTDTVYLPQSAVDIILENGTPTEEQIDYLINHVFE